MPSLNAAEIFQTSLPQLNCSDNVLEPMCSFESGIVDEIYRAELYCARKDYECDADAICTDLASRCGAAPSYVNQIVKSAFEVRLPFYFIR